MIFDSDDFGYNHVISDMCQSHDCRDILLKLKEAQPNFKATLFTIPAYMTQELLTWFINNEEWIELALHGFTHSSNYECEQMTYKEFDRLVNKYNPLRWWYVKGFKAPGWQISDDIYQWLLDNDWWVADQEYNDGRRPKNLKMYKVGENSVHTHTWDTVGNGVYELFDQLLEKVKTYDEWEFISDIV